MSISTIAKAYLCFALLSIGLQAQVPVTPTIQPHVTFVDSAGAACKQCSLYTYRAGTTTPLATYVDASGTSTNTNPIVLDASGSASIWVGNNSYKFLLKDKNGTTLWTEDQVNAGNLFPCASAGAIQIANTATTGLTCDPTITINTTTHTISVGTLPANHVTIGALGTPTAWTLDTTSPATACASIGCGGVNAGTINQLAYYASAGTTLSGTSAIPSTITATTQSPSDNSTLLATTAYVALPGVINPSSVQVASGVAMTDNQGNGAKLQHSTGTTTSGHGAEFDANGNVVDAGSAYPISVPRTCNSNGCYQKDGDGTIHAWGVLSISFSSSTVGTGTITFPNTGGDAFTTTTNLALVVSAGASPSGSTDAVTAYQTGLTTAGATGVIRCSVNIGGSGCPSVTTTVPLHWEAVGN